MEASDFFVEEFLDLTNNNGEDDVMTDAFFDSVAAHSTDSSNLTTPVDSSHSSASFPDHFSGELCVPFDDVAELEWLSNFVEDSFSSEDLHKYHHHIPVTHNPVGPAQFHNLARQQNPNPTQPSSTVPGKARSKRSRVAPCDWSTRLLMVAPTTTTSPATSSSDTTTTNPSPTQKKISSKRRENNNGNGEENPNGEVRRCLHCAAEKTPQWRTGPMGPKTLCNACGVRYKSGRLVPEYRPAASPTFISAKHSNSHRKVIELRRQKDMQRQQQHQMIGHHHHQQHHHMMMGVSSNGGDDYLIHHHLGPDYRQMI